tara:strand:+ start:905 stop:1594 length:690 start_codon:yes stop_codon:yes gene_type:complete
MRNILIALFASLFISSAALAGQYGIGVTGSFAAVSGEGTEANKDGSTDTSNRTANAHNNVIIPSVFAEYTMDNGFTLGYDYVIGSADVNSRKISRTDTTADDNEAVQDDGATTAQAEIENVMSIYAELPLHAGLYAKGGYVQMDVNTLETSAITTRATYGNETVNGVVYGLGYKNSFGTNGFYKVEGTFTDMDSMTFQDSNTTSGTPGGNKITADLDVTRATFAIGYNF